MKFKMSYSLLCHSISFKISKNLKSSYYIIMAEITDITNSEEVAIVIRWVDDNLIPHEEFTGLYKTDSITSQPLVSLIRDALRQYFTILS